jgi:hypothetical protein
MGKKKPLDIEHAPKNMGSALTTSVKIHKERHKKGVEYVDGIKYEQEKPIKGNKITKMSVTRANTELAGAYPYLFNTISYIATHAKDSVIDIDPNGFYYSITLPWDMFINITIDGMNTQKRYLENEIIKLIQSKQDKILYYDEHTSVFGRPVIVALGKDEENIIKGIDVNPTTKIQILFFKMLFKDILNDTKYINEPKAFYAKLVAKAKEASAEMKLNSENAANDNRISLFNRLWYYIKLHDNEQSNSINYDVIDLLKHIAPQYTQKQGEKEYIRDKKEAYNFLAIGLMTICRVWQEEKTETFHIPIHFEIDKNMENIIINFTDKMIT